MSRNGRHFLCMMAAAVLPACSDNVAFKTIDTPESLSRAASGTPQSEKFSQGYSSKQLDILFVVDNSGSMADEQQKLGQRISSFLASLYDVDWHVGITTTDVTNGKYGLQGDLLNFSGSSTYILTKNTPNFEKAFQNTIVRPESYQGCSGSDCPSGDEQPLAAAMMAIGKRDTSNKGFFRKNADLGLLILSDEDEMSTGPSGATTAEDLLAEMFRVWGDSKALITYGMVIKPVDSSCKYSNNGQGHYGTFVDHLAQLTSGLVGSICDSDYAPTLGMIGDHARKLLNHVQLKFYPEPGTVMVSFTPTHTTDYRVDGRRLYFDVPPPKGTQINIHYIAK